MESLGGARVILASAISAPAHGNPCGVCNRASSITNGTGSFTQAANLPANIPPGAHTITLGWTNFSGGPISSVLYFTEDATGRVSYLSTTGPQSTIGPQSSSSASALAASGFNAALGVNAIIVLIAAGRALLLLARRRNTQHSAHPFDTSHPASRADPLTHLG